MLALRVSLSAVWLFSLGCARDPAGGGGGGAPARTLGRLEHVGPAEFKRLAEEKGGLTLDVRTPAEVQRGLIPGATVIDIGDPRFDQKLARLQKSRPVFVYCASGNRSSAAGEMMVRMGFGEVYDLVGGLRGWVGAGFPLQRPTGFEPQPGEGLTPPALDALLQSEPRLLVDYGTPWCAPCQRMAPVVDALAEAWKGKARVLRVDVDASEAVAAREKIEGVPVFVLYVGGKERWRRSGELPREALEAELARP